MEPTAKRTKLRSLSNDRVGNDVHGDNVAVEMFCARSRTLTKAVLNGSFCGMEGIRDDLLSCRYIYQVASTWIWEEHTKILMATRGTIKTAEAYNTFLSRMNIA